LHAARSLRLSREPATTVHCLPGRLGDAGDLSLERQPAKAQAADAELAQIAARPSADAAAVVLPAGELGLACVFHSFCCSRHELQFLVSSFRLAIAETAFPYALEARAPHYRILRW